MFQYPEVHRGDEIDFAPSEDTPETMWILATIERTKNDSVDVRTSDGRRFLDVWHIGDPRLLKGPARKNTGVFKLVNRQVRINRMFTEHEAMKRRMDALEQTFRAVMESNPTDAVPAGRRPDRRTPPSGAPGRARRNRAASPTAPPRRLGRR